MTEEKMLSPLGRFPRFPSLFDEGWDFPSLFEDRDTSGLSISEDDKNVYIETAVPGVDPDDIEVSFDRGTLWVKADKQEEEEDKKKKFYRKSARSFSYRVAVPGNIDEEADPKATYKNGIMKITFPKTEKETPKKIKIEKE